MKKAKREQKENYVKETEKGEVYVNEGESCEEVDFVVTCVPGPKQKGRMPASKSGTKSTW